MTFMELQLHTKWPDDISLDDVRTCLDSPWATGVTNCMSLSIYLNTLLYDEILQDVSNPRPS